MELSPYIESLQRSLAAAAAPAGKEVADAAALLSQTLEPSARLSLLEAMSDAAAEITAALETATVEARLHGREVQFIITEIEPASDAPAAPGPAADGETDEPARISLRLPESLKESVERAASASGMSVNAWLVGAIAEAVDGRSDRVASIKVRKHGRSLRGFARS
jgi:hypothetical protein